MCASLWVNWTKNIEYSEIKLNKVPKYPKTGIFGSRTIFYLFLYIVQFQVGNTPSPDLSGEKHEDEAEPLPGLIAVKKKAKKKAKHYKVSQKCRVKKTPKKCSNKERS